MQQAMLVHLSDGNSTFIKAATGSGKSDFFIRLAQFAASASVQSNLKRIRVIVAHPSSGHLILTWESLERRFRSANCAKCFGENARVGIESLDIPNTHLLLTTPESFRNNFDFFQQLAHDSSWLNLLVLDEADVLVMESEFRNSFSQIISLLPKMGSIQTICVTATGSTTTIRYLTSEFERASTFLSHIDIGKLGFLARPDLDVQFCSIINQKNETDYCARAREAWDKVSKVGKTFYVAQRAYSKMKGTKGLEEGIKTFLQYAKMAGVRCFLYLKYDERGNKVNSKAMARVLEDYNNSGEGILIATTKSLPRANIIGVDTVILTKMPPSIGELIQLIGRCNRPFRFGTRGTVHILHHKRIQKSKLV